jgi:hypothetical protein
MTASLPADPNTSPAAITAITDDDVFATYYGVHVLSFEDGDVALTHDRRRAIAAFSAVQRIYNERSLRAYLGNGNAGIDTWLRTGWLRLDRTDGWWYSTTADDPRAIPATWLI